MVTLFKHVFSLHAEGCGSFIFEKRPDIIYFE